MDIGITTGKHIRLFLVDGSPLGIKTAEIMGWTGKVLSFPRGLLPEALKRPECANPGVYLLTGLSDNGQPLVYVGESDDVANRLKQHDANKAFFEQVTLIVSKDDNLTKSHVRYLEYHLIARIKATKLALLENGNGGAPVNLPEAEQSDMAQMLAQLDVLLPVLGLTFLQPVPKPRTLVSPELNPLSLNTPINAPVIEFELSALKGQIQATAYEAEGQFVVKAGSTCRHPDNVTEALRSSSQKILQEVIHDIKTGLLSETIGKLTLSQDKAFSSSSRAATYLCGNPMNGYEVWKVTGANQTYGDWRKQQLEAIYTP